ncbi:Sperm protamine like [Quillaja saponaria]|uniref:Sperm protamine like n=1 Tax=Quillaja saponaria TaxID=32244 RepID=A0AAD7LFQ0_QUISA|nr:Sperm protamine like [Quillaja saponaria]
MPYQSPSSSSSSKSDSLRDRIGLCYVFRDRFSSSDELKVAYRPRGNFNLRDFHHAVNNLPADAFMPDNQNDFDVVISNVLSDQVLYSWEGKDIERKVIVMCSRLPEDVDSVMQRALMDAAEKCVSVEFLIFQSKSSHLTDMRENINNFRRCISHLENCSFHTYIQDIRVLQSLVKGWLKDLKDDMEESLQACITFKDNLVGSVNHIFCNLVVPVNQIIDGFNARQTCRCHGIPLEEIVTNRSTRLSCPVTNHDLQTCDVIEDSVEVGEKIILFLPSLSNPAKPQRMTSPIVLNVIERTNLRSLSEGLMMGASYILIPSPCHETDATSDDTNLSDLNAQLFQGLCSALHSLDQGLVCSVDCNIETMRETNFHCYYILQPSDNGPMLLRRLAGSEEVLRVPDNHLVGSSVNKEIENSVQASLLKIDLIDYDPLLHERGFHQKLNSLVKESLLFGSILPKLEEASSGPNSSDPPSSKVIVRSNAAIDVIVVEEQTPSLDPTPQEDKTMACIAEEWEQLVVNEAPKMSSPSSISKPKLENSCLSPPDIGRQLDVETSKILERLEVPKQLKTKMVSPIATKSCMTETPLPTKKALIPFQSVHATDQALSGSQLMKPNFQRLKRKYK